MLTSRAVWALIVAYSTTEWGTTAMFTYLPTYMSEVLKFEIKQVIDFFKAMLWKGTLNICCKNNAPICPSQIYYHDTFCFHLVTNL